MQLRKRALVYPALMAAVALVLSVALLQLAQFGGQATAGLNRWRRPHRLSSP